MSEHMDLITNHEVIEVQKSVDGMKRVIAKDRSSGKELSVEAEEMFIATGRGPNSDILHPDLGMIETDKKGWIVVNEYLETSQPNIWAFGDANGKYLFKHVGNYESSIVYYNAVLHKNIKVDYHAVPHAVFSYPEMASVGLREKEAIEKYGEDKVLIGVKRYEDTTKGMAMDAKDYFVKVIVEVGTSRILGAHIIGPHASILIHQIIPMMYTPEQSAGPIMYGMDIHPSLSEVVTRAFNSLMPVVQYRYSHEHVQ